MKYDMHHYSKRKTPRELISKILGVDKGFYLHARDAHVSYFGFDPKLFFSSAESKNGVLKFLNEILEEFITHDRAKKETHFFTGGLVGYLSYDFGKHLYHIPAKIHDDLKTPDFAFGLYEGVVIFDHKTHDTWICAHSKKQKKKYIDWLEKDVSYVEEERLHDGPFPPNLSSNISFYYFF